MAIHYAKDGHVVTITIDRPEARNSLDIDHFGMLADSWIRFRDDDDAYVAILTGVQDVYCVGADLKKFVPIVTERADKLAAGESTLAVGDSKYSMAHSLIAVLRDGAVIPETGEEFTLYKPVIAAINGICAAGGMEMMWNTDLRVCADTAWFQLAEPRRGLFPGGGSTVHSARQLSVQGVLRLGLTPSLEISIEGQPFVWLRASEDDHGSGDYTLGLKYRFHAPSPEGTGPALALKPFVRTFRRKDGTAIALVLLDRYLKDASGQVIGLRTVLAETDGAA